MRPSSDRTPFYPPNPRPNLPPSSQLRERSASTGHRGGGPPPAGFYPPQPQSTPPSQYGGQRLSLGGQRPSLSYYDFPFAQSAPPSRTYLQNGPPPILSRRLTFGGSESFQTPASGSGGHARGVYAHAAPRHHCESEDSPSYRAEDQQFAYSAEETADFDMEDVDEESKKRPKTPPDLCAVCGATETPEWRKGPAGVRSLCNGCGLLAAKRARERTQRGYTQPATVEHMICELEGIGAERFKSPNGTWGLPPNTHARILVTIDRTKKQLASLGKNRSAKTKADKQAAGTLVASTSSASSAPRSPPTRTRRSSSIRGSTASNAPRDPPIVPPPSESFGAQRSYDRPLSFDPSSNKMSISYISAPLPEEWTRGVARERERQAARSSGRYRSQDVGTSGPPARTRTPSPGPGTRPSSSSGSSSMSRR